MISKECAKIYANVYSAYIYVKLKTLGPIVVASTKLGISNHGFDCPVCGYSGPFLNIRRKNASCPQCGSAERHRLQFLVVQKLQKRYDFSKMAMLHVAPEQCFYKLFKKQFAKYTTIDIEKKENIDYQADLCDLPFENSSYDCVFASHVLEHIKEDRKAISEIRRVLKPGGFAILPVPVTVQRTIEYPEPNPYEEYHVRAPGLDYSDRYLEYFSRLKTWSSDDFSKKYQLYAGEKLVEYTPVCFV